MNKFKLTQVDPKAQPPKAIWPNKLFRETILEGYNRTQKIIDECKRKGLNRKQIVDILNH